MKKIFTLVLATVLFVSCSDDETVYPVFNCDTQAQILTDAVFDEIETTNYIITNVVLNENCLEVTISSSGCNPDNWEMFLFSKDTFFDLLPLQRIAKLQLVNNESCAAVFQKTLSFDLNAFKIEGQNTVTFTIEGWNEPINYQY